MELPEDNLLFSGMTAPERAEALKGLDARETAYDKGEAILRAGAVTRRMGLMLFGGATIESNDVWGNRTILSHVGPGQFFAETYALLPGEALLVDVVASESCRVLWLHVADIRAKAARVAWAQKLLGNLLTVSAHKNLALSLRSFHTAPKTVRGRVMGYLSSVSLQRGSQEFDIPFDRQQLADYLNLERSALSKELGRMRREGIITVRKNHFIMHGAQE